MQNTGENPGLLLDHKHFVTATWRSFQRVQIDVLRPLILPAQFLTTNIGGLAWSDNWDHYAITADLDLASWDDYVGEGHLDAPKNAMLNDFVRGWKRKNFWVMETEPGSVNWASINNALWPSETRALAWQTIGHGADAVLYWQWRPALNGQEQYHGAIVGPDGKPLPIYAEIKQLGADLDLTRNALAGTSPHAEIAMLHDYDSRWAIDFQLFSKDYDQEQVLLRFYEPLERVAAANGQAVDIVDPTSSVDLTRYKLLVAPSLNVIDDALAAKLLAYLQQGGHLLLGPRSGMKNEFDSLNPQRQPGPLAEALGAKVEQYYALEKPVRVHAEGAAEEGSGANIWAEMLIASSPDAHVNLTYSDPGGWLDAKPAMITRAAGKGTISYLGALPASGLMSAVLTSAAEAAGEIQLSERLPESLELCTRTSADGHKLLILINHSEAPAQGVLPGQYRSLLSGITLTPTAVPDAERKMSGSSDATRIELPPQGVAVLVPEKAP
jgi:beta-galactosidase